MRRYVQLDRDPPLGLPVAIPGFVGMWLPALGRGPTGDPNQRELEHANRGGS
jgi:hypothetical protein